MSRVDHSAPEEPPTNAWDRTWQPQLDARPPDFESRSLGNHIDALKLEFIGSDMPKSGRAIEIGCGSARLLARVGRAAPLQLVGFDASVNALRLAAATASHFQLAIRTARGDVRALPFESGAFDLVLSGGLLEHFEDPSPVLSEMVRILRPGGVFYADVVPRKLSLYRIGEALRMLRSPWMEEGVYESSLGPRWYARSLAAHGLEAIRIQSAGVYPPWRASALAPRTRRLDGTSLADVLGWYFMVVARKA